MSSSKNAKLLFESGQIVHDYTVMADSGDHTVHTVSGGTLFSGKSGFEPIVRPNGVVSGRNMVTAHADADKVTIAAFTAYSKGTLHSVSATTASLTRAATDVAQIHSVTMTDAGAIAIVEGEDSASSALSTVRGAAGGPPSIPVDSVEIAQIRLTGNTPAVISSDEIFQTVGDACERFDYPAWSVNNTGMGLKADASAKQYAHVTFESALPCIHGAVATDAADTYKQVYIRHYTPTLVEASKAFDFMPVEQTTSVSSTQVYGNRSVGSSSTSLGQGGFSALLTDGLTDSLKAEQNEITTVKFFPDKNQAPYAITQGVLSIKTTYPVDNSNKAVCTISAENETANFSS